MSTELKKKRSSIMEKEHKNTVEISVLLELISNILRKEDGDKCICSDKIPFVDNKSVFYESEIVPTLEVAINSDEKIILSDVIMKLKVLGYPLTGAMISIFNKDANEFLFIGSDPIDSIVALDQEKSTTKLLKIRAVCYIEEKYLQGKSANNNIAAPGGVRLTRASSSFDKKKSKRTKERKIGYIIEKVNTWRKLYNGFYDENGKFTKYSLDDAAKLIGISKKSLDDYLLQLRLGRKYGFDFNNNRESKVGVLRSFVKKNRNEKTDKNY